MTCYVAVKTKNSIPPFGYKHFVVPEEVYTYIKQLETYVNFPEQSGLKDLYPERFRNEKIRTNC